MNQKEQEPVAWAMLHDNGQFIDAIHPEEHARVEGDYTHPLYTHPQPEIEHEPDDLTIAYLSGFYDGRKKREWVELTDEQLSALAEEFTGADGLDEVDFGRAVMAKYRGMNT